MIREGVENLCAGQDVETDEQDVVRKQHESGECISNFALSKGVVSKVTYSHQICALQTCPDGRFLGLFRVRVKFTDVSDLRVFHDEFVHCDRGNPKQNSG